MCQFDNSANQALDDIIAMRRTNRMFLPDVPPKEQISGIIKAGLAAPFAAAAIGGGGAQYFRQFFVFTNESRSISIAGGLMMEKIIGMYNDLSEQSADKPEMTAKTSSFASRLVMMKKMGFVGGVGNAPYFIVVAERKGFPPVEQQSLAHCLENMWLKATALNLGFQLVSLTAQMGSDPEFCRLIGVEPGVYELNGCAIGYPKEKLPPSVRPPAEQVTTWLE
jgi:nitroreductase